MVKRREVVRFFRQNGFKNEGGTNHDKFRHPDGRRTVIERHSEISNQQFEVMKKQAGLKSPTPSEGDEHEARVRV